MRKLMMIVLAAGLSFGSAQIAFSKAHVPVRKGQVCLNGRVIQASEAAIEALVERSGACELPACDFANVFMRGGDDCSTASNSDGTCVLTAPRDDAGGLTPACPVGKF